MTGKPKQRLRGIAAPVLPDKPPFVRLCSAFVDNLAMILRGAFIVGAIVLAQQFDILTEALAPPVADIEPVIEGPVIAAEPLAPAELGQPVLTDRVRHFLNCTYEDYREENYAECVDEPSGIYQPPEANPDDTGGLFRPSPLRLARHDPQPVEGCRDPVVCGYLL